MIVVDRLLTGFDAPCMSTIFIDRQLMGPHDLIQDFSRTNRIYDKNKAYGQIVTFQAPVLFKKCVDEAVKLYSAGGTKEADVAESVQIDSDYELMAYSSTKIDYEYIINLIQNIVTPDDGEGDVILEEKQKKIGEIRKYVEELRRDNPKIADIMSGLIDEIETDAEKYKGKSILNIMENMKQDCIDRVITDFCLIWYASKDDVMYAASHYRNGEYQRRAG